MFIVPISLLLMFIVPISMLLMFIIPISMLLTRCANDHKPMKNKPQTTLRICSDLFRNLTHSLGEYLIVSDDSDCG